MNAFSSPPCEVRTCRCLDRWTVGEGAPGGWTGAIDVNECSTGVVGMYVYIALTMF